jgi:hypothetical protein
MLIVPVTKGRTRGRSFALAGGVAVLVVLLIVVLRGALRGVGTPAEETAPAPSEDVPLGGATETAPGETAAAGAVVMVRLRSSVARMPLTDVERMGARGVTTAAVGEGGTVRIGLPFGGSRLASDGFAVLVCTVEPTGDQDAVRVRANLEAEPWASPSEAAVVAKGGALELTMQPWRAVALLPQTSQGEVFPGLSFRVRTAVQGPLTGVCPDQVVEVTTTYQSDAAHPRVELPSQVPISNEMKLIVQHETHDGVRWVPAGCPDWPRVDVLAQGQIEPGTGALLVPVEFPVAQTILLRLSNAGDGRGVDNARISVMGEGRFCRQVRFWYTEPTAGRITLLIGGGDVAEHLYVFHPQYELLIVPVASLVQAPHENLVTLAPATAELCFRLQGEPATVRRAWAEVDLHIGYRDPTSVGAEAPLSSIWNVLALHYQPDETGLVCVPVPPETSVEVSGRGERVAFAPTRWQFSASEIRALPGERLLADWPVQDAVTTRLDIRRVFPQALFLEPPGWMVERLVDLLGRGGAFSARVQARTNREAVLELPPSRPVVEESTPWSLVSTYASLNLATGDHELVGRDCLCEYAGLFTVKDAASTVALELTCDVEVVRVVSELGTPIGSGFLTCRQPSVALINLMCPPARPYPYRGEGRMPWSPIVQPGNLASEQAAAPPCAMIADGFVVLPSAWKRSVLFGFTAELGPVELSWGGEAGLNLSVPPLQAIIEVTEPIDSRDVQVYVRQVREAAKGLQFSLFLGGERLIFLRGLDPGDYDLEVQWPRHEVGPDGVDVVTLTLMPLERVTIPVASSAWPVQVTR